MNSKTILSLFSSILATVILTACSSEDTGEQANSKTVESNEATSGSNLIETDSLIHDNWIDTKGQEHANDSMLRTESIAYISSKEYVLSQNSYVSYFKDDDFIKTIRYSSEDNEPFNLESVNEANNIILSFYKRWENDITLTKE